MATRWFVKTKRSVRGPLSFQDVAFLIQDQQLERDGLVRREDEDEWQIASSVVGLLRAARKHPGLNEDLVGSDEEELEEPDPEVLKRDANTHSSGRLSQEERRRIIEAAHDSFDEMPVVETDRRGFLHHALTWGPLTLIAGAVAYAVYESVTYDRFENKSFEDT